MFSESELAIDGEEESSNWVAVSDLMAGLMIVFLFIAISFVIETLEKEDKVKSTLIENDRIHTQLFTALKNEFSDDLKTWNAEISEEELLVRFKGPEVLFASEDAIVNPDFQNILDNFFPRYIDIVHQFIGDVAEIRIEGHTSSGWYGLGKIAAYMKNMELSQKRTHSVLNHVIHLKKIEKHFSWIKRTITANGLSSSRPIIDQTNNIEDSVRSKRVEFRIRTKAEERLNKLLREAK